MCRWRECLWLILEGKTWNIANPSASKKCTACFSPLFCQAQGQAPLLWLLLPTATNVAVVPVPEKLAPICTSRNVPQTDSFFAAVATTHHKSSGLAKTMLARGLGSNPVWRLGYEFGNFQPPGICSYYCYLQYDKAMMEILLVRPHWKSCFTNHMHMGNVGWWKGPL